MVAASNLHCRHYWQEAGHTLPMVDGGLWGYMAPESAGVRRLIRVCWACLQRYLEDAELGGGGYRLITAPEWMAADSPELLRLGRRTRSRFPSGGRNDDGE